MSHSNEKKEQILEQVSQKVAQGEGRELGASFVQRFFRRVPAAEMDELSPDDLAALATGYLDFARQRVGHEIRFRVYNPRQDRHGWESSHTIIEIVNDDMPFLVDSITAKLAELEAQVHLIIHPILEVERDAKRRIHDVRETGRSADSVSEKAQAARGAVASGTKTDGGETIGRESLMHI